MEISKRNASATFTVNLFGGAIIGFHFLDGDHINPLSFAFSKDQMPDNNKAGAPYRGHFLCLGRWGLPSAGEIKAGVPNHGEIANIVWRQRDAGELVLKMETTSMLEGLRVERSMQLDHNDAVLAVKETVSNINPLGRLYNMVQHPTLAAPFLNASTIINSNATIGFNQSCYKQVAASTFTWPNVKHENGAVIDLRNPAAKYNSVFSFVADKNAETGWISAYSPEFNLLFGYVWQRSDYPWIHLWQHWEDNTIKYRGIEFGTAGIHQPFKEILMTSTRLFGEKTFEYIDAGESVSKKYFSFLYKPVNKITGVNNIKIECEYINVMTNQDETIRLHISCDQL
ncbi:MAG TPA: hypothetical protein VEV83_03960 [Parafilimonas sp.]|nr:hypothetical protein [Parafilimonas sp.]